MKLRSLLFVPGDSDRKFEKAGRCGADALIFDLEDAVAPPEKEAARGRVAGWLDRADEVDPALFVRVNPFDTGLTKDDVAAIMKPGLAGIVLPKTNGAEDVAKLSELIDPIEREAGMEPNGVKILVVATETARAMFTLDSYAPAHPRLLGLTWGAEDLGSAIGVTANKDEEGAFTFPFQVARALCLFAATKAEVAPVETLYADFRDMEGLEADCLAARRDGFVGRLAIHPAQVETINRCFTPSDEELAHAQKIVDAFAAQPEAGTLGIDGKMVDIPHLKAARKMLAAAGRDGGPAV